MDWKERQGDFPEGSAYELGRAAQPFGTILHLGCPIQGLMPEGWTTRHGLARYGNSDADAGGSDSRRARFTERLSSGNSLLTVFHMISSST